MVRAFKLLLYIIVGFHFCAQAEDINGENKLIIEDITCEGNGATSCDFIRGFVRASPGDNVEEQTIENAKLRLMAMPNFKSVATRLEKGSERGRVVLIIQVEEGSAIITEGSFGLTQTQYKGGSSRLQSEVGGRMSHQNLFGRGRILDFEFSNQHDHSTSSNNFISRLQYVEPNLFKSEKNYLILGTEFQTLEFNEFWMDTKGHKTEANITLGRRRLL